MQNFPGKRAVPNQIGVMNLQDSDGDSTEGRSNPQIDMINPGKLSATHDAFVAIKSKRDENQEAFKQLNE